MGRRSTRKRKRPAPAPEPLPPRPRPPGPVVVKPGPSPDEIAAQQQGALIMANLMLAGCEHYHAVARPGPSVVVVEAEPWRAACRRCGRSGGFTGTCPALIPETTIMRLFMPPEDLHAEAKFEPGGGLILPGSA